MKRMNLFPQDSDVVIYETGFGDDILERRIISKQLSDLVERMENPLVVALDDTWGSGKTYFLKRWVGAHAKENGGSTTTVYFDAFENDYLNDPLVSIIAAVRGRIPERQEPTFDKLRKVAAKLARPTLNVALSLATLGASQHLSEIGGAVAEAIGSEAKDAANTLWQAEEERQDAVRKFKCLLHELTGDEKGSLVIVVDELDRCRPDYALSVLEVIKHFFAVPKVHFILGINRTALEASVKARYGADIDAEGYLRKFINLPFSLPRTLSHGDGSVIKQYAEKLRCDMGLPKVVTNNCVALLKHVEQNSDVSLRDVGKVFSKIALLPEYAHTHCSTELDAGTENWPAPRDAAQLEETEFAVTLCVLLVSSVIAPELHKKFVKAEASAEDIRSFIGASENKTRCRLENGDTNPDYNERLAFWFLAILSTFGLDPCSEDIDWHKCEVRFNPYRLTPPWSDHQARAEVVAKTQRLMVEVF